VIVAHAFGVTIPTLATAQRIIRAAGFDFELVPVVEFVEVAGWAGRLLPVPTRLPRIPLEEAIGRGQLPLHPKWATPRPHIRLGIDAWSWR
jgi:hypothetical protein